MLWLTVTALANASPRADVAYLGELITHPGAVGRLGTPLAGPLDLEAQAGVGWHPGLMTSLHARVGPALLVTGPRGGLWGAFAHVGATHGLWTSPTWTIDEGDVARRPLSGDSWLTTTGGIELGHALERSEALDGWFVRPQVGLRFPTFHGAGIDVGLEVGVRFGGAS